MELTVKDIEEKIKYEVDEEPSEPKKFKTNFANSDGEVVLHLKEVGSHAFNIGDRIELKRLQSQTTLVPIKRGRPRKVRA